MATVQSPSKGFDMKRLRIIGILFLATVAFSGCKKVVDEKTSDLESGKIVFYSVPAVKSLTVDYSTDPATQVDIYVVAEDGAEKAKADLQNGKEPTGSLASQKAANGTLSVTSSAKTGMTVLVTSSKKTKVTVKMNGS
jgi:hypothetical protein